ncbi:OmpP1/FadL family transporter [Legionella sp. CNM-4043-24]|uniref:OmpP1/FadL family transporter n=1 Tax=Legionella sp. CNM-4043-24 TaxID=3421646 RepID=UPI00403ABAB6
MHYRISTLLCLAAINAHANVIQYIAGISYSNPAELFKVQKNEFIIGGTGFYTNGKFEGTAINFNTFQYEDGVSNTNRFSFLPYGRIATRLSDKVVFGVDVTQPIHSNLVWGANSFSRYAATDTLATDVDISPRLSFSVTRQLYIGAGLNFNFLQNNESNWAMPISQTEYAKLINRTYGFNVGYDLGMYYAFNQTNFFGAAFFSAIKQNTRGTSWLANQVNNNLRFDFSIPATSTFSFVHIFNPKWLISLQALRTDWSVNQYVRFKNTAATPKNFSFEMKFKNSWAYIGALRRQLNEKMGLTLVGVIDNGPEQDHLRTINFPSDTQYFLALSADYHFNKSNSIELLYGHGYSKTLIAKQFNFNGQLMPLTTGRVRINADVVDLKYKIQM